MAATSIRWVLGRCINFIEPPAFITLQTAWLSSMHVHVASRCSRIPHGGKAGSNSIREARSAATDSVSSMLWDTQVCRREAML
eukprot:251696-Pyramimonas_sp.AAC.1